MLLIKWLMTLILKWKSMEMLIYVATSKEPLKPISVNTSQCSYTWSYVCSGIDFIKAFRIELSFESKKRSFSIEASIPWTNHFICISWYVLWNDIININFAWLMFYHYLNYSLHYHSLVDRCLGCKKRRSQI